MLRILFVLVSMNRDAFLAQNCGDGPTSNTAQPPLEPPLEPEPPPPPLDPGREPPLEPGREELLDPGLDPGLDRLPRLPRLDGLDAGSYPGGWKIVLFRTVNHLVLS